MALPAPTRKLVESKLSRYCDEKVPPAARGQVRLGFRFRGNTVTVFEERPQIWLPDAWITIVVAQFRFDSRTSKWTLYCADRNSRWHEYLNAEPTRNLDDLIEEVDRDPTGIFWG
jgi:hypothetical protein